MATPWVLFAIILVMGEPHAQAFAFTDQAHCEAAKAVAMTSLAKQFPNGEGSFTCFQTAPAGKII